jgi:hypothetical protein
MVGAVNNLQEPLAPLPQHAYLRSTVAGTRNSDGQETRACSESEKSSCCSAEQTEEGRDWFKGDRIEISRRSSGVSVMQRSRARDMRAKASRRACFCLWATQQQVAAWAGSEFLALGL